MIQRVQTIFLTLAAAACFSLLGLPFATTGQPVAASALFADARYTVSDQTPLLALFSLAGALALIAIFFFKNRRLQMRLAAGAAIALLLGAGLAIFFFLQPSEAIAGAQPRAQFGALMPLAALTLLWLAHRAIRKDERLVRSMDRLR
jgi:hypothetical protein